MRASISPALLRPRFDGFGVARRTNHTPASPPLPRVGRSSWSSQGTEVSFPTAIVAAPDGTLYVGSDPMDMPGPATEPIDRVLAIKSGKALFSPKSFGA